MTSEPFIESGMNFSPCLKGHCFCIEKSNTYKKLGKGEKIAEFLLLRQSSQLPTVWVVEAKSSSPRLKTHPKFAEFIGEIRDKLVNALTLGVTSCLKRHESAETELPELFKTLDLRTCDFKLVLIINGHSKNWLPPLLEALKKALRPTVETWGLSAKAVAVINDERARQLGLIT